MPRHLISDAHEWINEIPTVPIYYLAKPQPRERAWQNQRGKKTLKVSASMGSKAGCPASGRPLVQRLASVGGRGQDNLERGKLRAAGLCQPRGEPSGAVVTRGKVSVPPPRGGLRDVLIPSES